MLRCKNLRTFKIFQATNWNKFHLEHIPTVQNDTRHIKAATIFNIGLASRIPLTNKNDSLAKQITTTLLCRNNSSNRNTTQASHVRSLQNKS